MNITFRQIQIFEAVALHSSYTRAAELLHLSQPAVSMQIKQLEQVIELPLFERIGKRLFLTDVGREFLVYARNIRQQITELSDVMNEFRGSERGRLTIAVATTAHYFALKLLGEFYRLFPEITISLDVTNRANLVKHLEQNTADMVIMGRPPEDLNVEATPFLTNPLVVIASNDHSLAHQTNIPLSVLQQHPFILREHGSGTRTAMQEVFEQSGFGINSVMEMNSNEAINQAVQAGLGLGIVSYHCLTTKSALDYLQVLDVVSFPIMRHWYLVHRRGKRLTGLMSAFKKLVIEDSDSIINSDG